jgi:hypothetical protein
MSEIQTTQTTQTANEIQKDKCYKLKRSWQMCVSSRSPKIVKPYNIIGKSICEKSYKKYISECGDMEENRKRRICSIYATH